MKTTEDIESYLIQIDSQCESLGENVWIVKELGPDLIISIAGPVVVFRMKVLDLNNVLKERREVLFRTLLELNSKEMLHGAYGLEGNSVVVTDALQLENLDFNEFQATIDDMSMAVSNHYSMLAKLAA